LVNASKFDACGRLCVEPRIPTGSDKRHRFIAGKIAGLIDVSKEIALTRHRFFHYAVSAFADSPDRLSGRFD